jgi:type IX secretion system PorP/SprF family membrane protein
MILKNLFLLLSLVSGLFAFSQQLPQYSQYLLNRYVINPASAGSENYFVGQTNFRSQWSGIRDAPRTYILSANGPIREEMGLGGYLFVDATGPTRRNGFSLSYAYHLNLNSDIRLSMALNAGILQYSIDGSEIIFEDASDELFINSRQVNTYPDAGFSFYLYADNYFFGASAPQLIRNELDFDNTVRDPGGRLSTHFFVMGGYKHEINSDFAVEPSFLLKYVKPVPMQYEFSVRGMYQDLAWLGFSYRKSDAIVLLTGINILDNITLAYAYDIIQSDIRSYSTGSHEIMLSVKFNNRPSSSVSDDE